MAQREMNGCLGWLLLAGGAAFLLFVVPGDWALTPEQRAGVQREEQRKETLGSYSDWQIAEYIGEAHVYGYYCNARVAFEGMHTVYQVTGLTEESILAGGRLRNDWERGAAGAIELFYLSDDDPDKKELSCFLGKTAYGENGSIIPGLLRF